MKKIYNLPVVKITDLEMTEFILAASPLLARKDMFADDSDVLVNAMDDEFIDIWENIGE